MRSYLVDGRYRNQYYRQFIRRFLCVSNGANLSTTHTWANSKWIMSATEYIFLLRQWQRSISQLSTCVCRCRHHLLNQFVSAAINLFAQVLPFDRVITQYHRYAIFEKCVNSVYNKTDSKHKCYNFYTVNISFVPVERRSRLCGVH